MLLIAICDDDGIICSEMESMILKYAEKTGIELEVHVYMSGEELCKAIDHCCFDLVFLDIELCKMSGIQVGEKIRCELRNETTQIVFVSSRQGYAMKLFDVRPLHFLLKPLEYNCVADVIEKMMVINEYFEKFYEFQNGKNYYRIPLKHILYFEGRDKKIHLTSKKEEYEFYGKISDVFKKLDRRQFIKIHQSYIVNHLYVEKYRYDSVVMVTGEEFTISQSCRKAVREWHMNRRKYEFRY